MLKEQEGEAEAAAAAVASAAAAASGDVGVSGLAGDDQLVFITARRIAYAMVVVVIALLMVDGVNEALQQTENLKWFLIYFSVLVVFYIFSSPFQNHADDGPPSYFSISTLYITWLLFAALYHLPPLQQLGIDVKVSIPLYLTIYVVALVVLVAFHLVYIGVGFVSHALAPGFAQRKFSPRDKLTAGLSFEELWVVNKNSMMIGLACCVLHGRENG